LAILVRLPLGGARRATWGAIGTGRLVALIGESAVTQRILRHLGLPTEVPAARPALAPPLGYAWPSTAPRAQRGPVRWRRWHAVGLGRAGGLPASWSTVRAKPTLILRWLPGPVPI